MKDFIPYQEALELKKLAFDEPCFGRIFADEGSEQLSYPFKNSDQIGKVTSCSAPTYSQAFRFFRKKYGLNGISPSRIYKTDFYQSRIIDWNTWNEIDVIQCSSYEDAELACLRRLIEIVKQNKNK